MDSKATTVLISIHPKYVDLIAAGKKKIEFRKRSFSHPIKRFVVYSTAPVSKVVGFLMLTLSYVTPLRNFGKLTLPLVESNRMIILTIMQINQWRLVSA